MKIKYIFNLILSSLSYLLGGLDSLLKILLILIVIDYITGICKGIYRKELSSKKSLKGTIKKIGYIIVIILGVLADKLTNNDNVIRTIVVYFFIANEAISILENWALMELPLPNKLLSVFENIKKNGN